MKQDAKRVDAKQQNNANLISCPTWHRPLFRIVPDGIEVKCKFCGGALHTISREKIEEAWAIQDSQSTQEKVLATVK